MLYYNKFHKIKYLLLNVNIHLILKFKKYLILLINIIQIYYLVIYSSLYIFYNYQFNYMQNNLFLDTSNVNIIKNYTKT